jgi:Methylase involved in ubiquinone/menaquinone biosynthesis
MGTKVKPYQTENSKKEQVQQMFDNIAHRYDFLNRFLSLGIDIGWRKKAVAMLEKHQPKRILDVATGTADFALATLKLNPDEVIGIDISEGMLDIGRKKNSQ